MKVEYRKSEIPAEGVQAYLIANSQTLKLFLVLFMQWHDFLDSVIVTLSAGGKKQGQLGY